MNYSDPLRYLNSLPNYERWVTYNPTRAFNLDRMRLFLERLGHPEKRFPSVLVAGTKGKGSTVAILSSILHEAGYRVGMYTSPHLEDLRERIQVDGCWISAADFARGMTEIRKKLGRRKPTYFEAMTLLAFLEFARRKVDIAVVEVGLGGRLDATNTLEPLVSLITSISYDHEDQLGHTLHEIAKEKSAIIHRGSVVVSAPQEEEVMRVIQRRCEDAGAKCRIACGQVGTLSLLGDFQKENASVAVCTAQVLRRSGFSRINQVAIRKGLRDVRWPGRFEIVSKNPRIILDGAHNGESMEALVKNVKQLFPGSRVIPVLGISQRKDLARMSEALRKITDTLIVSEYEGVRAWDAQSLVRELDGKFQRLLIASPAAKAIQLAKTFVQSGDVILVTGSLYLVGEVRKLIHNAKH